MTHAGFLLSCTERITVVNGIASIWAREPQRVQGAAVLLADAYPGRHVLGLGFGDARPDTKPLQAMTDYLDKMDATSSANPTPTAPMRRLLAAYGPKMLQMARERSAAKIYQTASVLNVRSPLLGWAAKRRQHGAPEPSSRRASGRLSLGIQSDQMT